MTEKHIKPKYNKLRLVYAVDSKGCVVSYCHVENKEAERIIKILKFLSKNPGWISMEKLAKGINQKYCSVVRTVIRMSGVLWADMKRYGRYERYTKGKLIYMKKAMMNKNINLNPKMRYLKANLYVSRASA